MSEFVIECPCFTFRPSSRMYIMCIDDKDLESSIREFTSIQLRDTHFKYHCCYGFAQCKTYQKLKEGIE